MSFGDAVRSGFDNYAQFDGRASRAAFWWWFLFNFLVGIAANIVGLAIGTMYVVSGIVSLALLLPNLSVGVRRLHDTDRTGWWLLIALIPLIGLIVLLIFFLQESDSGENSYGPPPADVAVAG